MKVRYTSFYRRMLKPILDILVFKSNNEHWDKILKGVDLIRKYIDTRCIFYPETENIPAGLITKYWKDITIEKTEDNKIKIRKHYFELCVLEKLSKTLKCKEIYVERSLKYRNPCEDLPKNWEEKKEEYYQSIKAPIQVNDFINPIRNRLHSSLVFLDKHCKNKEDVYIYHSRNEEQGYFRVPKILKQEESELLKELKHLSLNKFGMLDLLDVLLEADRLVDLSRFFNTYSQRQVLKDTEIRERLLLNIFSLGTNLGLKTIYNSTNPNCSYDDLLYFQKRFINTISLRNALVSLTNKILEIRNPSIWGTTKACASDGKQFSSYDQNLIASSNPHYQTKGIMVYWHVDTNSTCIYSQIKNSNSSEVIAMIEGLIKHETEMKITSNYTDSRGQSEIAFAFCHFLDIELLPRLRRIKYEKLCIPDNETNDYENLKSVINRTINWKLIEKEYDNMVKHIVAISKGTGSTEAILRRFSSYNTTNPTYKAFIELGKAIKTIFLCNYLSNKKLRIEIHEGLNIVESWNAVNTFIFYGNKTQLTTNDPLTQEISILCLHILQNALILINTMILDKVIIENNYLTSFSDNDFRALTPLYTSNINPYGNFTLDLNKKPLLEVAL